MFKPSKLWIVLLGSVFITVLMSIPRISILIRLEDDGYFDFDPIDFLGRIISIFTLAGTFLYINITKREVRVLGNSLDLMKPLPILQFNIVLFIAFQILLMVINRFFNPQDLSDHQEFLPWVLLTNFFIATFSVMIATTYKLITENHATKMAMTRLEHEKSEIKFQNLKEQISPHFFFNALFTLNGLIDKAPKDAKLFVHQMSDVYRYVISNLEKDTVPVIQEYKFCCDYVEMLKIRFSNAIEFESKIIDPQVWQKKVPPLSIQLLIENAVKHNLFNKQCPLKITIEKKCDYLLIRNNLNKKGSFVDKKKPSIGLHNLNQRYLLMSNREILITQSDDDFIVEIPLLE